MIEKINTTIDVLDICKSVLSRLVKMDYETKGGISKEQLIFPLKSQANGQVIVDRVSEQELRYFFIEEFKLKYPSLFYSIETPTVNKFSFGKSYEEIKINLNGQSASHDMCIHQRVSNQYKRVLNIEFKHRNSGIKHTGKDILKLMHEKQDGLFIHLLENTKGTTLPSVFNKLCKSFVDFQEYWNDDEKSIQLVVISLKEQKLIHCTIKKTDLISINDIFYIEKGYEKMRTFKEVSWKIFDAAIPEISSTILVDDIKEVDINQ